MVSVFIANASRKRASELEKAGLSCCTHPDGLACPGAGKIIREKGVSYVTCSINQTVVNKKQSPTRMSAQEARNCTRKTQHKKKAPHGP